jgi:galactonate dehydratase
VLEHFNDFADPWLESIVDGAPVVDPMDGCFVRPGAPGLGVHLRPDAAAEHPRTRPHLNLVAHGWERRGSDG